MTNDQNEAVANGQGTIELGGVTYLVSPPNDTDFATLRRHLKKQLANPLHAIAEDLKGLPPDVRQAAIKAAVELQSGGGAELTESYIRTRLMEPAGAAFLAWLVVRKSHPDVTLEALAPHFTEESTPVLLAQLSEASGLDGAARGKATGRSG